MIDVQVFAYDENATQTLPCVLVGIESENTHPTLSGNFELKAFIAVLTAGYDDPGNDIAETIVSGVFDALDGQNIACADGFYFDGSERQDNESSTSVFLSFTAFTHLT